MTKRIVRVALLMCDTPVPDVVAAYGIYIEIYRQWLLKALETYPDPEVAQNTELIIDGYDVVEKGEYPPLERLQAGNGVEDGYDAVMLTGSKHSAHETTVPWISTLISFVSTLASSPTHDHLKLIGICFGHQIISIALGGKCERGANGWELGVYGCELTDEGRKVFDQWSGVKGIGHGGDRVFLEQVHRDHVPALPPGCVLLLSTPRYPVHGYVRYKTAHDSNHNSGTNLPTSSETSSSSDSNNTSASITTSSSNSPSPPIQILTVQGHPEFTPDMVLRTIEARVKMGIFDEQLATEARRRAVGRGDGGEGFGRVGWSVWKVLLQD
ncbi:cytoplasmic protein [Kwoniella heveanensis CBS 569]|uniref:Cytoplasmic protein n=1 Tax=Kwoniella heveanensis BCC8398 TaxID=1296120 RepID=A0A1B9GXV5_9TREE|nr:cytoplasmic protein [Kwoniella heveanensis BCC8398]OCF38931.1 cytoplasmic protein [Kwoniella heveanensis CBS 569]